MRKPTILNINGQQIIQVNKTKSWFDYLINTVAGKLSRGFSMATKPRKYVQKSALINQFLVYLLYSLSKMMIAMTRMYMRTYLSLHHVNVLLGNICLPNIEGSTPQPYTIHTFTQLWRKKLRQDIIITQHYIKHNHESSSLSWLLYIYLTESFAMYPQNHRISNDVKRNSWGQFLVCHQSIKVVFVLIDKFEHGK